MKTENNKRKSIPEEACEEGKTEIANKEDETAKQVAKEKISSRQY